MNRKHIITISGKPGSGKSSTADKVAELLGYTRHSSGDMVRNILAREGMTLAEYNAKALDDHNLDTQIDEYLRKLRNKKDIVIDSRLGFYWLPESFKVYLDLDIQVATVRIYKDAVSNNMRTKSGEVAESLDSVAKQVKNRMETERSRFRELYGVDPYNPEHFDLVIDTSRHSPQTVALTVFDTYRQWLKTDTWKPVHSAVPLGYSFKDKY
ncbi:MAG: cytidylate kinase family protein [Candidatus Nomurabacteria bacterium]|nr:MAG: cytidylate kinase family protein [Candidatus Nomurabacteria bacterium]